MLPSRYDRILTKVTLQARADLCAAQQAVLFLALGLATVLTFGHIVEDQLYESILNGKAIAIGVVEVLFGLGYLVVIQRRLDRERPWFALAVVAIWFGFAGFYLQNEVHKIGAITCLCLAAFQLYGEWCRQKADKLKHEATQAFWHDIDQRLAVVEREMEERQSMRRFWSGSLSYWRQRLSRHGSIQ